MAGPRWRVTMLSLWVAFGLAGLSCGYRYEPGVEVEVRVQAHGLDQSLSTDLGYEIEIESAWIVVDAVEIVPCEAAPSLLETALRWMSPMGQAHAHGVGSPTRLATPVVLDLKETSNEGTLAGYLYPPDASYCGVQVGWGPADEDALWLEKDPEMLGLSLRLAGSWTRGGSDPTSFVVETSLRYDATTGPGGEGETWNVDLVDSPHLLRIRLAVESLFDGLHLEGMPAEAIGEGALLNLPGLMAVEVGGGPP